MGIFKNTKTRNIVIYITCAIITIALIVTTCILLWPKEEKAPELPKSTSYDEPQPNSDGHYYETVSCEELAKITGKPCDNNTETPTPPAYTPSYTPNYTTPEPTQTPTTPQYNVPNVEPTPTYTPSCAEYHKKYYSEYTSKSSSIRSSYNNMISSASMSCNGQSGCPAVTNLKRQLDQEIATIKTQYKSNMTSVGCDPSEYVDF